MKVNPTHYDCILFMLSHSLFHPTATQRIQKRQKSTDKDARRYVVKQVEKVIDEDTFDVTLLCTEVALFSSIQLAISGTNCVGLSGIRREEKEQERETQADSVELSGMHTEEQEQEAQEVLSECLNKAEKIEVLIYYPADKDGKYLGSLYVDDHLLGDMLLKESFGEEVL